MTLKSQIINFIRNEELAGKVWVAGGTIDRYLSIISPEKKPSNVSRRCRELCQSGVLERRDVKKVIDGRTLTFVEYRIKPMETDRQVSSEVKKLAQAQLI